VVGDAEAVVAVVVVSHERVDRRHHVRQKRSFFVNLALQSSMGGLMAVDTAAGQFPAAVRGALHDENVVVWGEDDTPLGDCRP